MEKIKRRPGVWGRICWAWRTRKEPIGGRQTVRPPLPDSDRWLLLGLVAVVGPLAYWWYKARRAEIDRQWEREKLRGRGDL